MGNQAAIQKEKERKLELTCDEARLVLKVMDDTLEGISMKTEERAAIRHYINCEECRKVGLAEIRQQTLSCREALEIWAAKPGALWLDPQRTLLDQLAVEHVWGRMVTREGVSFKDPHYGACQASPCTKLRSFWQQSPLCLFYDGEREAVREIPLLIEIFLEEKWPLDRLLKIQEERMNLLLKSLVAQEIPSHDCSQYHNIEDLASEVMENIRGLQKIVRTFISC